jgi:hypothetical protein
VQASSGRRETNPTLDIGNSDEFSTAASVLLDERLLVRAPAFLPRQAVRSGL